MKPSQDTSNKATELTVGPPLASQALLCWQHLPDRHALAPLPAAGLIPGLISDPPIPGSVLRPPISA